MILTLQRFTKTLKAELFLSRPRRSTECPFGTSQPDALFLNFILIYSSTYFGQTYCPSSGTLILYSQQLVFTILVLLTWRIKTNDELRHRVKQEDIIKFIKSQRLRWAAHVMRMENTRTIRTITEWTPYKTRPAGRPG